jgi:para-nitrobenzyl esterase
MCPQYADTSAFDAQIVGLLAGGFEIPSLEPSENCLALNVWTPELRDGGRRPVMVWCHGGRFSEGSGGNPWCDGSALAAQQDVVVVTLNHRLNIFGYLDLQGIVETNQHESDNAGMLDIVAALEWIKDNIVEFGGDPGNVTLFGSSGGGSKITTLLAMPAARGLFHKAIVQSASLRGSSSTRQRQQQVAMALLAQLGFKPSHMDALHTTSAGRLVRAAKAVENLLSRPVDMGIFVPTVDGRSLNEHPFASAAPALGEDIPLLIGTNHDEMTLLLDRSLLSLRLQDVSPVVQRWATIDRQTADRLVECYRDMLPMAGARDLLVALTTDYALRASAIIQAEYKSLQRAPVYMYRFQWRIPAHGGMYGATHGAEVPFTFGNVVRANGFLAEPSSYQTLEQRMSAAWASFARSGNPNHADLPYWPPYSAPNRSTMYFGGAAPGAQQTADSNDCIVMHDPDSAGRLAMRAIDAHRCIDTLAV